jgi:DNA-binding SARP family transcriptional activator
VESGPAPRVTLLHGFALNPDGMHREVVDGVLPRGIQRLVAHLCLCGRLPRTAVAGRLWPDVPEGHAQGSLRSALWRLQKAAPGLLDVSGGALTLSAGVRVDVQELGEWARKVSAPGAGGADLGVPCAELHGELLPGWYDDWVLLERERLRQVRMHALEVVAVRLAAVGRYSEALEAAYAAVREEPLRESAHRAVVRVHLCEGNLAEAVRTYERFRTVLLDELGVVPTEQMTQLVHGIPRLRSVG